MRDIGPRLFQNRREDRVDGWMVIGLPEIPAIPECIIDRENRDAAAYRPPERKFALGRIAETGEHEHFFALRRARGQPVRVLLRAAWSAASETMNNV